MAVDSADRVLGPASEQLVRTEAFADVIGLVSRMRYLSLKRTERMLRQQWHLWNLPAATDVRRLSEQVASLERQVRDLTRELEDRGRPARAEPIERLGRAARPVRVGVGFARRAPPRRPPPAALVPSLTELLSPNEVVARVRRDVERSVLRARNGIKHVAGIDRAQVGLTPKDTVWDRHKVQLWHYRRPEDCPVRFDPPILLVMSLVSRSYVLDLRPGNSVVELLIGEGFDVYMLDWGVPDEVESAQHARDLLRRVPAAAPSRPCARTAARPTSRSWGYCFGGVLSVLSVAGQPRDGRCGTWW